jgi:hypothetical protein
MDDVTFMFLMFLMVVGGTCSIALCVQILQCCLLRFCDKEEKVANLQIRDVPVVSIIENPMIVQIGTAGNTDSNTSSIKISIEEDPKN